MNTENTEQPTPAPPFRVQYLRDGSKTWGTDRKFLKLDHAREHAEQLHAYYDMAARVVDQNDHVWLRRP